MADRITTLEQGQLFAERYELGKKLGEGGMGAVYASIDTRLGKEVAIKVLREDFNSRKDLVQRFMNEAQATAAIAHENIVDVTDRGQDHVTGLYFICYEKLEGCELLKLIEAGTMTAATIFDILQQVCSAISAAHGRGILHRDLKPENIFIVKRSNGHPHVKILDFGIAKFMAETDAPSLATRPLTAIDVILGTPNYMSFEQLLAGKIDKRSDVHALGVILYEMITGHPAFEADTPTAMSVAIRMGERKPLSDAKLEAIVAQATRWNSEERTPSVAVLAAQLEEYAREHGLLPEVSRASALPPPPAPTPPEQANVTYSLFEECKPPTPPASLPPARALKTHLGPIITDAGRVKHREPVLIAMVALTGVLLVLAAVAGFTWHKPSSAPTRVAVVTPTLVTPTPIIMPATDADVAVIAPTPTQLVPDHDPDPVPSIRSNEQRPVRLIRPPLANRPHCVDQRYAYHDGQCCRHRSTGANDCDGEVGH